MPTGLQEILDLIKKTGDRLIVLEMPSQTAYAVMNLDDYERLWRREKEDDWLGSGQEKLPGLIKEDDNWLGENDWLAEEKEENEEEIEEKEEKNEEEKTEDERYYFESLEP